SSRRRSTRCASTGSRPTRRSPAPEPPSDTRLAAHRRNQTKEPRMPRTPIPHDIAEALKKPNQCVVATIRPDGELSTAATWYEYTDDGRILLNMDASRARMTHLRADPRVALTIFAGDD